MKLRGISPMQPVCEICDEVLNPEKVGRVFQNNFFHEKCFPGTNGAKGTQAKIEPTEDSTLPLFSKC